MRDVVKGARHMKIILAGGTGQLGRILGRRGHDIVVLSRGDTELLLKSRRVVPGRLLDAGFHFELPHWAPAANDLVARRRRGGARP